MTSYARQSGSPSEYASPVAELRLLSLRRSSVSTRFFSCSGWGEHGSSAARAGLPPSERAAATHANSTATALDADCRRGAATLLIIFSPEPAALYRMMSP